MCARNVEQRTQSQRKELVQHMRVELDYELMGVEAEYGLPQLVGSPQLSVNTLKFLKAYDVHPIRGFLPADDPDERLDMNIHVEYDAWESIISRLPELLSAGKARKEINELPNCDNIMSILKGQRESQVKHAMLVLCVIAQAYIFEDLNAVEDRIPDCIAVPLCDVAEYLRVPPILSHMSIILNNWRKKDPDGPLAVSNLESLCVFHKIQDEDCFFMSTVEIEANGGPAIAYLVEAQELIRCYPSHPEPQTPLSTELPRKEINLRLLQCLQVVSKSIESMCASLDSLKRGCDPEQFYSRIRIFLQGFNNNPILPSGIAYGGTAVDETVIDAILGVKHAPSKDLAQTRNYMPEKHRLFVRTIEDKNRPNLCAFVTSLIERERELTEVERNIVEAYTSALDKLQAFRSKHMGIAASYILAQSKKSKRIAAPSKSCCVSSMAPLERKYESPVPCNESPRYLGTATGTGGSAPMEFLRQLRDDVKSTKKLLLRKF